MKDEQVASSNFTESIQCTCRTADQWAKCDANCFAHRPPNLRETTPIKRLYKLILKLETEGEAAAWWLGYCDGGCWPQSVYYEGQKIIAEQFKK